MAMNFAQLSHSARLAAAVGVVSAALIVSGSFSAAAAMTNYVPTAESPVAVGEAPSAVAYGPNLNSTTHHPSIFVANSDSDSISIIDAATQQMWKTVKLKSGITRKGASPAALAVDVTDDLVYVADRSSSSISILDGASGEETDNSPLLLNLTTQPDGVAWDSSLNIVYVSDYSNATVMAFNGSDGTPLRSIDVGQGPKGLAYDPTSKRLFVAAYDSSEVDVIESGGTTVSERLRDSIDAPISIGIDSTVGRAYVANSANATVSVLDIASETFEAPISVGGLPQSVAVDEFTHTVYVACSSDNTVTVIDSAHGPRTKADVFGVGNFPVGIAVDTDTHTLWTANQDDDTVSIVQQTVSPTITSAAPTVATVGVGYSFPIAATAVPTAITFSTTGQLPPGISVQSNADGSVASLFGTPTESGDFTFTLHATNGIDPEATATYTLHVDPAAVIPTPTPTPTPTPPAPSPATPAPTSGSHLPTVAG